MQVSTLDMPLNLTCPNSFPMSLKRTCTNCSPLGTVFNLQGRPNGCNYQLNLPMLGKH